MIFFPAGESKTSYTFPPWATIAFMLASVLCFVLVHRHVDQELEAAKAVAKSDLEAAVNKQMQENRLDQKVWLRYQSEPNLLENEALATFFDPEVRQAWRRYHDEIPPLTLIQNRTPWNLLLGLTPHHLLLLLMGLAVLWCSGYLMEHLFDRQIVLGLLLVISASGPILARLLPIGFLPTAVFHWSFSVFVFCFISAVAAPRAKVTLALRGWFFKRLDGSVDVSSLVFPICYLLSFILVTRFLTPYADELRAQPLVLAICLALVFSMALAFVPTKSPAVEETKAQVVERRLAAIELQIEDGLVFEAQAQLEALAAEELDWPSQRMVADLAWKQDLTLLAQQGYRSVLRKTIQRQEDMAYLDVLEEVLFRHIELEGKYLLRGLDNVISKSMIPRARKLLPYLIDGQSLSSEEQFSRVEAFAKMLLEFREPDRHMLLDLYNWLETHRPEASIFKTIHKLFDANAAESNLADNFGRASQIHRMVEVDLLNIQPDRILIQVTNQQPQHVPWSAFLGLYGCHLQAPQRGYRGCMVVQFKRKIFACSFTLDRIKVTQGSATLTFEAAWSELQRMLPEGLPSLGLADFEDLGPDDSYQEKVEAFINRGV